MLRISRRNSIIVPREVHDRLRRNCAPEPPETGAVVAVRSGIEEDEVIVGDPLGLSDDWPDAVNSSDISRYTGTYIGA